MMEIKCQNGNGVGKMLSNLSPVKKVVLGLAAMCIVVAIITANNLSSVMMLIAARNNQKALEAQAEANRRAIEIERRAKQVDLCLASEPIVIGEGNNLWLHVTDLVGGHLEAYTGCGLATAYIADGKIIAWHYGNERPSNAPACDYVQLCEVSCTQMLF